MRNINEKLNALQSASPSVREEKNQRFDSSSLVSPWIMEKTTQCTDLDFWTRRNPPVRGRSNACNLANFLLIGISIPNRPWCYFQLLRGLSRLASGQHYAVAVPTKLRILKEIVLDDGCDCSQNILRTLSEVSYTKLHVLDPLYSLSHAVYLDKRGVSRIHLI